jgi:DNA-binding HxlR family transcriptional regulator
VNELIEYDAGMSLPSTYADRNCSLARTLEIVGERWTLLIIRDAFYGIQRFGDFATQLGIPRAVLTNRLKSLVQEGVLSRSDGPAGTVEYRLTDKGIALWPAIRTLMSWGDTYYSPAGVRRVERHGADSGVIDADGRCRTCGGLVPIGEILLEPGPGFRPPTGDEDPVSGALEGTRHLLDPFVPARA